LEGQRCGSFKIRCVWDEPGLKRCRASAESGQGALDRSCVDSPLAKDIQIRAMSRLTFTYGKEQYRKAEKNKGNITREYEKKKYIDNYK
jgi:hypothetical protein